MSFPDFDIYLNRILPMGQKRFLDNLSGEKHKKLIDKWKERYELDKKCYTEMRELLESEGPLRTTDFFKKLKGKYEDNSIWGVMRMFTYDEDINEKSFEDERCHYYDTLYKIGEITEEEYYEAFDIEIWDFDDEADDE